MRVLSYFMDGAQRAGILNGDRVLPLVDGDGPLTMRELLDRDLLDRAAELADEAGAVELSAVAFAPVVPDARAVRSEEHTSELQSRPHLVCRLLLEKKNK